MGNFDFGAFANRVEAWMKSPLGQALLQLGQSVMRLHAVAIFCLAVLYAGPLAGAGVFVVFLAGLIEGTQRTSAMMDEALTAQAEALDVLRSIEGGKDG